MKKLLSLLLLFSIATPALAAVTILPSFSGGTGFGTYAQGDIIYASALNTLTKLTIGNNGQCLTSNGTTPGWGACASSAGGAGTWATTTSSVTNRLLNYSLNTSDIIIIGSTSATSTAKFYFDPNLSLANILGTASTTNLVVVNNSTTTNATSTNFFSTTASTSNLFAANIQGAGLATCNGSTSGLSWAAGLFGCVTITPAASSITGGQALTKTDDTNVTLTLGGSPSTSLLAATSLTLGWTGTLADSRVADNLTISGGTVDNSPIGATTKSTGQFTTILASSSTTLQNFTGLNSTTTNATTTSVISTNASTTNLWVGSAGGGTAGCATFSAQGLISNTGTACGSGGGTNFLTNSSANTFLNTGTNLQAPVLQATSTTASSSVALALGVGTTSAPSVLTVGTSTLADTSIPIAVLIGQKTIVSAPAGGTYIGINAPTSYTGYFIDFQGAGAGNNTNAFQVRNDGAVSSASGITATGDLQGNNVISAAGSQITWNGRSVMKSPSDGVLEISNNAVSDFTRLQFGGTTSAFPSIKRSGTGLLFRLADDSGDANFTAGNATTTNATTTSFAISNIATGNCLQTTTGGAIVSAGGACGTALSGGATNALSYWTSSSALSNISNTNVASGGVFMGIGTTTPKWLVQLATSTAPQLTLSDATAGDDHLSFRWISPNLYIASSSNSTFATSSTASLQLNTNSPSSIAVGTGNYTATLTIGNDYLAAPIASTTQLLAVGSAGSTTQSLTVDSPNNNGTVLIATTTDAVTRTMALSVNGRVTMRGITASSGVQTGVVCIGSNNELINDSVACLASSQRFKQQINTLGSALDEVMALRPVSFYYKPEFNGSYQSNSNYNGEQVGFIAEEVQKIDPRLVVVETAGPDIGLPHSVRYENITAILAKAIQELDAKIGQTKRSAEENWQWVAMALMLGWIIRLEIKTRK